MSRWQEVSHHTFYAPPLDQNAVVLDLGASTAAFSQAISERVGCHCHAIEALEENFRRIPAGGLLHAHHYAVGGSDQVVSLHSADEGFASGIISPFPQQDLKGTETVQGVTLARLLDCLDLDRVTLLKVDIEGAEFEMFENADDETLRRLDQITIEFHDFANPALTPEVREIIGRMERLGYWWIKFTREFHGDVVFLNPERTKLSRLGFLWAKYGLRNFRGLVRMLSR